MARPQKHLKEVAAKAETPLFNGRISEAIAAALTKRNAAKPKRPELHVSDLGRCPRAIGYRLMGEQESDPVTVDSLVNFAVGEAIEDKLAQILGHESVDSINAESTRITDSLLQLVARAETVYRNITFSFLHKGTTITGHADMLLRLADFEDLVEIKSINSRAMSWMLKQGENGKADHRLQLGGYLYASHHIGSPIKPHRYGTIVYVVKDATKGEPCLWEARVDMNEEIDNILAHLDKIVDAERMAMLDTLPEIPEGNTYSKYPCTYCDFRRLCHGYITTNTEVEEAS